MPVKWGVQLVRLRREFARALEEERIDAAKVVQAIGKLLKSEKRVVSYGGGMRQSEMIPDVAGVRAGVELALEVMGLRKAHGFDVPDGRREENEVIADALVELTCRKMGEGWDAGRVSEWLRTEEGVSELRRVAALRTAAVEADGGEVGL